MTYQTTLKTMVMLLLLTVAAFAQKNGEQKTFTGTWTCLNCDLKGLDGSSRTQCEDLGHRHCLRLDKGKYLFFLDNDHATALIKGGGRHEARMTVKGIYHANAYTIDVQTYVIDGITTAWCPEHQRMDMCCDKSSTQAKSNDSK